MRYRYAIAGSAAFGLIVAGCLGGGTDAVAADPAPAAPPANPAPVGKATVPAAAQVKPALKITPGRVIVPTDKMRRPWGELIELDLKTRTGSFRKEGGDEVLKFTVLPYAELLHHAANGDLQDFKPGERAIFRLHENEAGEWVYLTYIQDEMNFLFNHKEYYHVDKIDAEKHRFEVTDANADKSYVRKTGIPLDVDSATRYWKGGKPAKFEDVKVGDKLRTKTHGNGSGEARIAWEVFLDDESLVQFQTEQKAVHLKRLQEEGLPGYVDAAEGDTVEATLFREGSPLAAKLKAGRKVRLAPAGVDRKPTSEPIAAQVVSIDSKTWKAVLKREGAPSTAGPKFTPTELLRLWIVE